MKKFLNKAFSVVSLIFLLTVTPIQSYAISSSSLFDILLVSQQKTINYEKNSKIHSYLINKALSYQNGKTNFFYSEEADSSLIEYFLFLIDLRKNNLEYFL